MLLKEMSDEDLIFLINRGSMSAETVLYGRYSVYSHHQAKKYYIEFKDSGITEDEFYAVALAKIPESLSKYGGVTKKFYIYWKTVVRNAVYDYVRENSYKLGAKPLGGLSFDDYRYKDSIGLLLSDKIGEEEKDFQIKDVLKSYLEKKNKLFTDEERKVMRLRLYQEYSAQEISKLTGLKLARVNYIIRSSKKKLQEILKENYL